MVGATFHGDSQSWYSVDQKVAATRIVFDFCCWGTTAFGLRNASEHRPMPRSKKLPPLHRWRISLIKSTPAATIGYVEAPHAESVVKKAI
jgi:hypothetical protein